MLGLRPIRQFLRFLLQKRRGAIGFKLALHAAANVVKRWRCRWLDRQDLVHRVALGHLNPVWRCLLGRAEDCLRELRSASDSWERIGPTEKVRGHADRKSTRL